MKFINLESAVISILPIPEREEIFVGTYSKIVILNYDFEVFQEIEVGRPVRAIAADKKGNVFAGLSSVHGDTLLKIDKNRNVKFIRVDGEPLNILSLCVDAKDDLWIGTLGLGLLKFDGYNFEPFNTMNSDVNDDTIFSLFPEPDTEGQVWFGCKEHGFGLTNTWDMYEDRYNLSPELLKMMLPEYGWKRYLVKMHHNPGGDYMDCNIGRISKFRSKLLLYLTQRGI
jgi:ligand-binding sensor domain-containing protein